MTAADVLNACERLGVRLAVDRQQIELLWPVGTTDGELAAAIRTHTPTLIGLLRPDWCAATAKATGSPTTLVCNRPVGHDGPHGVGVDASSPPYVRWTDTAPAALSPSPVRAQIAVHAAQRLEVGRSVPLAPPPTELRSPRHRPAAHDDGEEAYVERDGYLFIQYSDGCQRYVDTLPLNNPRRASGSPAPTGSTTSPPALAPRMAKAQLRRGTAAKESA
jgi:hypothetical protein